MNAAKRRPKAPSGERIMVAVRDEGDRRSGQASLIDSRAKAEQIVAGLIEAGIEPHAVRALHAEELPLRVSYRWSVELAHRPEDAPAEEAVPAHTPPTAKPKSGFFGKTARFLDEMTPDSPFQLRMDRVLWLGLWAASLVILAISLMASFSRGDSRQFVVGPNSSSSERTLQAPGAALESNSRPGVTPTASPQPSPCATGSRECQCNDFATQPEAQAYYQQHPPASGHDVDPDRDGVVCEWLPATAPASGH
jgi:hypothetical protein